MTETHIKTTYKELNEPIYNTRTKGHIGDHIKFVSKNGYNIPIGIEGIIDMITKSYNPLIKRVDWHYRIKFDFSSKWIMAAGTWKVI